MLTNSVPVLIGAMIVAPVFLPLALVTFALVAGHWRLALRGLGTAADPSWDGGRYSPLKPGGASMLDLPP